MPLLFVYGTLMSGCTAHGILEGNSRKVGEGTILGDMYVFGTYPGATSGSGVIKGEVYEIPITLLEDLDKYEGYRPSNPDDSLFIRRKVPVKMVDGNLVKGVQVYFYRRAVDGSRLKIASGDWRTYMQDQGIPKAHTRHY